MQSLLCVSTVQAGRMSAQGALVLMPQGLPDIEYFSTSGSAVISAFRP